MKNKTNSEAGFSLIELMVVIAIIGVLITMGAPDLEEAADHIKVGLARGSMNDWKRVLVGLRATDEYGRTWVGITGAGCLFCEMGAAYGSPPPKGPFSASVLAQWRTLGFDPPPKDPWGHYYLFDQNDEEFGPTDTRCDILYSAGPNGIWDGPGDQTNIISVGDDIMVGIPKLNSINPNCTL